MFTCNAVYHTSWLLTRDHFVIIFADLFWNISHEYNLAPDVSKEGINGLCLHLGDLCPRALFLDATFSSYHIVSLDMSSAARKIILTYSCSTRPIFNYRI